MEHSITLKEEPRSVLQDGSVSLEAQGGGMAWQPNCVIVMGGKKGKVRHNTA